MERRVQEGVIVLSVQVVTRLVREPRLHADSRAVGGHVGDIGARAGLVVIDGGRCSGIPRVPAPTDAGGTLGRSGPTARFTGLETLCRSAVITLCFLRARCAGHSVSLADGARLSTGQPVHRRQGAWRIQHCSHGHEPCIQRPKLAPFPIFSCIIVEYL